MDDEPSYNVLVTGGAGLVGKGIEWVLEHSQERAFRRAPGEKWILLSRADGDLR
jgi:GDP-L-fucose synthase